MSDRSLPVWFVLTAPDTSGTGQKSRPSPRIIASLYRYGMTRVTLSVLALVAGIYALIHGHTEVLVWLAWGFLPRFVMRIGRPKGMVLKESDWDDKLAKRSQGESYWFPGELIGGGVGVHFLFWLKWQFFTSYEVIKQEADYFIIRLWRATDSGDETPEPTSILENRDDSVLRVFARSVPMLVTVMALCVGYQRFGWRADVLVALFLSLQFYLEARLRRKIRRWVRNAKTSEDLPYLDVAFDSSKVTLEEARTRLDPALPERGGWI